MTEAFPRLNDVLIEHIDDFHEVIPYLYIDSAVDWMAAQLPSDPAYVREFIDWLELKMHGADQDLRDLIGAGAVEAMPYPGHPGSEMREWFGPELRTFDD